MAIHAGLDMGNIVKTTIVLSILCCLYAGPAICKTYKCQDADGNTVFSDTACNAVTREELNLHEDKATATLDQDAVKNCLAYLKSTQQFPDPDSVKIEGSRFAWVAVKGIGSRRMLHLNVLSKNQYGVYTGATDMHCLLMGDGRTISTYPYELLDNE